MRGEKNEEVRVVGKIAVGILRSEAALSLDFRTEPRLGTARESIPRLSLPLPSVTSVMPLSLGGLVPLQRRTGRRRVRSGGCDSMLPSPLLPLKQPSLYSMCSWSEVCTGRCRCA